MCIQLAAALLGELCRTKRLTLHWAKKASALLPQSWAALADLLHYEHHPTRPRQEDQGGRTMVKVPRAMHKDLRLLSSELRAVRRQVQTRHFYRYPGAIGSSCPRWGSDGTVPHTSPTNHEKLWGRNETHASVCGSGGIVV